MTPPTEREEALCQAWKEYAFLSEKNPHYYELEPLLEGDGLEDVPTKLMEWAAKGKHKTEAVEICNYLLSIVDDYLSEQIEEILNGSEGDDQAEDHRLDDPRHQETRALNSELMARHEIRRQAE